MRTQLVRSAGRGIWLFRKIQVHRIEEIQTADPLADCTTLGSCAETKHPVQSNSVWQQEFKQRQ